MKHLRFCFILLLFAVPFHSNAAGPYYVFYLHGAIVEGSDGAPVSPQYGKYNYAGIISALKQKGYTVFSEIRPAGTDPLSYAKKIAGQIDSLKAKGISPGQIAVIGASKGAVITMLVSGLVKDPKVKYIPMGGCNDAIRKNYHPDLYGQILSVYESSDDIGLSCREIKADAKGISKYKELELHTGLHHGYLYNPMKEWLKPACSWIED